MKKQLAIILLLMSPVAIAQTITVKPGSKITSISQALSLATPGDTIYVEAGTYKEGNIKVDKSFR